MTTPSRKEKIETVAAHRQKDICLVLEDIFDPHNAEAIVRTCDAFGIQTMHLVFDTTDPFNPRKVGKATSSSANKWLDFEIYKKPVFNPTSSTTGVGTTLGVNDDSPIRSCLVNLKKQGYTVVATALTEKAQNLYEFKWPEKIALLIGNEHAGLSKEALELADFHVQIPMQGLVQSLNVSVSTGIFLSEIYRSRLGKNYSLSEHEQQNLVEDFLNR